MRPRRRLPVLLALVVVTGCGGQPAPPSGPSHEPGPPGLDWATAVVERPPGMEAAPPSIPPVDPRGGGLGHGGHFSGQGNPYDLAAIGDRLVAVGYVFPGFYAATWSSTDRRRWSLAQLPPDSGSAFALSIAAGAASGPTAGSAVIVGRIANDAAAWRSADGTAWSPATGGAEFIEAPETRMTTVVAGSDGYVAGGWAGVINQPGKARFWTSPDGAAWTRGPDGPAMADGRVAAIAAGPGGYLAVGTTGPVGHPTGTAVWRSADGRQWGRIPGGSTLAAGQMLSVTAGGPGYVAVGSDLKTKAALVWLSADGATWQLAPSQESLTYHGLGITIADVIAGPNGQLVAVGHFLFGQQFGQGTAWTSADGGRIWTRMPDEASLGQGEPQAVIPDGPGYVATGTVGAPDNYIPTVWVSPSNR